MRKRVDDDAELLPVTQEDSKAAPHVRPPHRRAIGTDNPASWGVAIGCVLLVSFVLLRKSSSFKAARSTAATLHERAPSHL
eukprot:2703810-Prymnesium_polylepis.1